MSWLTPLGLLGLLGLIVLILIYLLKPNYQQKAVSSTFVWKLSLKYKKRKNPISRLRHILILLCQILIIVGCALVLAQPAFAKETAATDNEKIFIVDASASMRASTANETRFERAVLRVIDDVELAFREGGNVTVIIAGKQAEYLAHRATKDSDSAKALNDSLYALIGSDKLGCTYGSGDIEGAMELAERITSQNPLAQVSLYTGTKYLNHGSVDIVDVSINGEFNVAVLGGRAEVTEGSYSFFADVASYGEGKKVDIECTILGANPTLSKPHGELIKFSETENIPMNSELTVEFNPFELINQRVYGFDSVTFSIEIVDSFFEDNTYVVYGGARQKLKIEYFNSQGGNPFFSTVLLNMADVYRDRMDFAIDEIRKGTPVCEGYDFYIFEDVMPQQLPTDGIVLLVNPNTEPVGSDIVLGKTMSTTKDNLFMLAEGEKHPITQYIDVKEIGVSKYTRIVDYDRNAYAPLMFYDGDPIFLVKNQPASKVMVMAFSVNYSTLAIQYHFPAMIYSIFEYFLPMTTDSYVYDVNQEIQVNARGSSVVVSGPDGSVVELDQFPSTLVLDIGGSYTFDQMLMNGNKQTESIFVRIPNEESNIVKEIVSLDGPVLRKKTTTVYDYYPIFIILGVAVALLFVEWWLHSREA